MLTQPQVDKKTKKATLEWNGWTLQLGRNDDGTFGVWTFRGQPVAMISAAKA